MFVQHANIISPYAPENGPKALMQDTDGDGKHDVILEKDESGNTYLHLVMPASAVNFLNGSDGSSLFHFEDESDGAKASADQDPGEVFVELGCKIYEVNKVNYRGRELGSQHQQSLGSTKAL